MRSLGNALRGIGLLALALWIANALVPRAQVAVVERGELAAALPRITSSGQDAIDARLDVVPGARERDWLAALRDAGVSVRWNGNIAPVALETFAAADPAGAAFVLVSAADTSSLADAVGPIDTLAGGRGPAVVRIGDARGDIVLTSGRQVARASVAPPAATRRVLVVGAAGWEAKFLAAAIEEAGWLVDLRLRVRPDEFVIQGELVPDTSRHSAVVLLDTSVAAIRALESFVRSGGGVVFAGSASRMRAAAPLIAWRASRHESAPLGVPPGDTLWRGQSRVMFDRIDTARAVVLERREGDALIVARRHYAGRVLAVGYDNTWRWRMAGGATSVAEHRDWWSRLVASVAFRPKSARELATGSAPLAALHAALGPPVATSSAPAFPRDLLSNLLGAIALGALLAEWVMRRLRGAR